MELFRSFFYINLLLMLPILVFGLVYYFINTSTTHTIINDFGWNVYSVIGFIGVPIHELSHLITSIIFGHKITSVCLYDPKGGKINGTLGYVEYIYNPSSNYQQIGLFFSAIAPMIGGSLVFLLLMKLLLPITFDNLTLNISDISFNGIITLIYGNIKVIHNNSDSILKLLIFILLSCAISINMDISKKDLSIAIQGLVTIEILLVIFSLLLYALNISIISYILDIGIILILVLSVGLFFSLLSWLISLILSLLA